MKPDRTRLKFLLSFSLFTLVLLLYVMTLVQPGTAEFVITVVTLILDAALLAGVLIYIRRRALRELREGKDAQPATAGERHEPHNTAQDRAGQA